MEKGFVIIKTSVLQQLLDNFYDSAGLCDELNIYEFPEGDESLQEMRDWTEEKFGRKITKENYD